MMNQIELYDKALRVWGIRDQVNVAMEECGELIVALSKFYIRDSSKVTVDDLASEVADVMIMCEQIARNLERENGVDVQVHKKYKLTRLKSRLDKYNIDQRGF